MKSILFAEWLAENHYQLCNVSNGTYYWESESDSDGTQTTLQLKIKFDNTKQ